MEIACTLYSISMLLHNNIIKLVLPNTENDINPHVVCSDLLCHFKGRSLILRFPIYTGATRQRTVRGIGAFQ